MTENREALSALIALIAVLKAVSVTGPDADGLLWVHFEPHDLTSKGAISVQADSLVGKVVAHWRDARMDAIMKTAASIAEEYDGISG